MNVIPYSRQYIDEEDIRAVNDVLRSDYITTGPKIEEFEKKICEYTGAGYAVAVSSGTAALHLVSLSLLNKGDMVITTANSFAATANSILYSGAVPVFIDIQPDGNIDLELCAEYLENNSGIKAIYPVHFSGKPVDQEKLKKLKEKFNLKVVEDCAHSLGAFKAGSCYASDASVFSFHPVKSVTTGEGGMITTNNEELYKKLLRLRSHGISRTGFTNTELSVDNKGNLNPWYYEMQELGFNYRITDLQCALGLSQLAKTDKFISLRKEIALKYYDNLKNNSKIRFLYDYNNNSSYHLFVLLIDFKAAGLTRAELITRLKEKGVGTQVHYIPVNLHPYYQSLGYGKEQMPVMYKYYEECLSIPIYPGLTPEETDKVITALLHVL